MWKYGKSHYHIFQQVWKQDKRCNDDRAPVSLSISMWQSQSFMWRTAVVCCWQGTVWKVTVHIACVCVCVHSSVYLYMILCPLRMNLCWLTIMRLGETKERDPNRHSAVRTVSIARACCLYVSNPRLNQGWLPSGLGLHLNRLYWRNCVHARTLPGQSSFVCNVYQSVTGCVYVYGSSRPSWPRCPDSPITPLSSSSPFKERH